MAILVTAQVNASSKFIGLAIVFTAGACYSIFSPAFNLSTNDQWHKLAPGVDKLVIYTAFFYFSLAFFGCAILINVCFLYKPAFGVPKSSIGAYLKDWNGRWIALLAGVLCGWGNGFQFMGGQAAGYAAADAVQVIACGTLAHVPVFAQEAGHVTGALVCIFAVLMSSLPTFSALPSPATCPALPCPAPCFQLHTSAKAGACAGSTAGQYLLGRCHLWGVPACNHQDLHLAGSHALHVCCSCWSPHGLLRHQEKLKVITPHLE